MQPRNCTYRTVGVCGIDGKPAGNDFALSRHSQPSRFCQASILVPSKAFGSTPETWLRMQLAYDLAQARKDESKIKVRRQHILQERHAQRRRSRSGAPPVISVNKDKHALYFPVKVAR